MKNTKRKHRKLRKPVKVVLSLLLILTVSVGGTVAYLISQTGPVVNTFTPAYVDCVVEENFDGMTKSNVNVKNTSDIDAFIRVKLITYRVNDNGDHIGGTATIPAFTLGTGWFEYGGFYYYTNPVAPDNRPVNDLIGSDGIVLKQYTGEDNDADGGKQVIEVMAEAIQSKPNAAVEQAWKVKVDENGNLTIPAETEGGTE